MTRIFSAESSKRRVIFGRSFCAVSLELIFIGMVKSERIRQPKLI